MLTCFDIADYFLSLSNDEDSGELISNMKLQKLVYYAQGFYLAKYNKPLFSANIEAWALGPVIPELYHKYKEYGGKAIPPPRDIDFSKYDEETKELLDEVYVVYGQYSAWKLSELTHNEPPWKKYHLKANKNIPPATMIEYFKTQLAY